MYTMTQILTAALSFAGIVFLIGGLIQAKKLRDTLKEGTVKNVWDKLSVLISVFIVGYLGLIVNILYPGDPLNTELVTATVFFLGGIFVMATAYYNRKALTPE